MAMRFVLAAGYLALAIFTANVAAEVKAELVGVKIKVPSIEEARDFYIGTLKFEIDEQSKDGKTIWLRTNSYKVVLVESKDARRIKTPGYSHVSMSMRVNDIDETFKYLKSKNVKFIKDEKRKEGIGWSIQVLDPFGNKISMMQITVGKPEQIVEPSVYNCGLYVTDIEKALKTYQDQLGFVVRSRNYMPEDMPLGYADKRFAFILHLRRSDFTHVDNPNMMLMFNVADNQTIEKLKKDGVHLKKRKSVFEMIDETGITSELSIAAK